MENEANKQMRVDEQRRNIEQYEKGGFSNNPNQVVISQNTYSIDKEISNRMKREDSQIIKVVIPQNTNSIDK